MTSSTNPRAAFALLPLALAAAALAGARPASAQAAMPAASPAPEPVTETVVVTGTRAHDRTVLTSAAPIDILSGDEVRRAAGADGNLAAALQALLPSFNFPRQSNSSGSDHVRAAQLRGLSPDQVLVLVNGKRRHTTAVVNLDTKIGKGTNPVDFNSIPVNAIARIEVLRDGAGAQYGSDAIGGVINVILDSAYAGGEAEATVGANHTHFEPTGQTITDGQAAELRVKQGQVLGQDGFLRYGAELTHRKATNRAGYDDIATQIDIGFVDDTPGNRALDGHRNYRTGEPEVRAINLWANAEAPLAGTSRLYGFATFDSRDSLGAAFFRYPDSSQNVPSIHPNGFLPVTTGHNTDLSVAAGAKGDVGPDWSYDASLTWGDNAFDYGVKNSVNASLGADSPTVFHLGDFSAGQLAANLDLQRSVPLPGWIAPGLVSVGTEARRETFSTRPGDPASYEIGPVDAPSGAQAGPGLQPGDAVDLSRTVYGVYASFEGRPTTSLFTEAGIRYDHVGDTGGKATGKLSGRWEFTKGYALRATASTNYRAPSLPQSGFSFTVTDRGTGGSLTEVRTLPVSDPIARALGATDLKPETARNFSVGLTAKPMHELRFTLDAYRIDIDDRITLSERVSQGANEYDFFTNAVDTRTQGVDLVSGWSEPLAGGDLDLTLTSSWNHTSLRRVHDDALIGLETRNTLTNASPNNRHILTAGWHGGALGGFVRVTRQGETTRVFDFGGGFTPTQTYAATWQWDVEAEWKPVPAVSVAIGGLNVTDRYPSRSSYDISYFNNFPYDVLSPIGYDGAYYYLRLRWKF